MKTIKLIGFLGIICFFVLLITAKSGAQEFDGGWRVEPGIQTLSCTDVKQSGHLITFTFKNVSDKKIESYRIAFNAHGVVHIHGQDWFDSDAENEKFMPGDISKMILDQVEAEEFSSHDFKIIAVTYPDGTGEGNAIEIQRLRYEHLGRIFETERINKIFGKYNNLNDENAIKELKNAIGQNGDCCDVLLKSVATVDIPGINFADILKAEDMALNEFASGISVTRANFLADVNSLLKYPEIGDKDIKSRSMAIKELRERYSQLAGKRKSLALELIQIK
jgi:hypothetical protein